MTKRLLVVEDDPCTQDLLCSLLEGEDLEVVTAHNVPDAWEIHRETPADAVLTNLMMPLVDGLEFIDYLRNAGFAGPILVLSGALTEERRVRALRAGACAVIPKPFDCSELIRRVREAMHLPLLPCQE